MYEQYQRIEELKTDFLNMAKCWVYSVLYYHQIYPKTSFEMRTLYGVRAPVSVSAKLKQYIDKLFKQFDSNFRIVNYLEIELTSQDRKVSNYRLSCEVVQSEHIHSRHQKQTEFKYFLRNLQKSLQKCEPIKEAPSFNFYIEYRCDGSEKIKTGKFIDNWLLDKDPKKQNSEELVGVGLRLPDFNVIATKIDYD